MLLNHGDHGDHGDIALNLQSAVKRDLDLVADKVLDSAFKIHRLYGPGLLESAYEALLCYELMEHQKLKVERQKTLPLIHEGMVIDAGYRLDILVANEVVIELKACEKILPVHEAQILTYLKLSQKRLGIILNFNCRMMKDGIKRFML